jgi:hypothetical protein
MACGDANMADMDYMAQKTLYSLETIETIEPLSKSKKSVIDSASTVQGTLVSEDANIK